jgi:CRP-like cAMP-binding protein
MHDYIAGLVTKDMIQYPSLESDHKDKKAAMVDLLAECPIMKGVDASELEKLAEYGEYVHFPKEKVVVRIDDVCNFLHIISKGLVKIYKMAPSGRQFTIDIISRGEIIIGGRLFNGSLHFAESVTICDSELLMIPKRIFIDFTSCNPQVLKNIGGLENFRLENMFNRLMDILTDSAYQRVVKTIIRLAHKFGDNLRFNHRIIAELSGTTSETVARILTHLKNYGAIKIRYGEIQIIDHSKLLESQKKEMEFSSPGKTSKKSSRKNKN